MYLVEKLSFIIIFNTKCAIYLLIMYINKHTEMVYCNLCFDSVN